MEKAVATNIAKKKTGLRPDIWLHHLLAVTCFWVVLATGEFHEEATMLTAVETTCALPVAFGEAAKAKQLRYHRLYWQPVRPGIFLADEPRFCSRIFHTHTRTHT